MNSSFFSAILFVLSRIWYICCVETKKYHYSLIELGLPTSVLRQGVRIYLTPCLRSAIIDRSSQIWYIFTSTWHQQTSFCYQSWKRRWPICGSLKNSYKKVENLVYECQHRSCFLVFCFKFPSKKRPIDFRSCALLVMGIIQSCLLFQL